MFWFITAVIFIWLVFMPLHFRTKALPSKLPTILAKVASTIVAAGFAAYACFSAGNATTYAWLILAGLCVCVLADAMLEIKFVVGGALFFLGHMLYITALALYRPVSWWNLGVFAVALAGLWVFLSRYRRDLPQNPIRLGLAVYAAALAALLAFSLPLPFLAYSRRAAAAALGTALFVASDLTLCHNVLRKAPVRLHYLSLGMYYMGQLLLALSAFQAP